MLTVRRGRIVSEPAGENDGDTQTEGMPEQVQPDNGGWGSQAVPGADDAEAEPGNGGWGSQ